MAEEFDNTEYLYCKICNANVKSMYYHKKGKKHINKVNGVVPEKKIKIKKKKENNFVLCECGVNVKSQSMYLHLKSRKHFKLLNRDAPDINVNKKECECGCYVTIGNMEKHLRSKKHIRLIDDENKEKVYDSDIIRVCKVCNIVKNIEEFKHYKSSVSKYRHTCLSCHREKRRIVNKRNYEKNKKKYYNLNENENKDDFTDELIEDI